MSEKSYQIIKWSLQIHVCVFQWLRLPLFIWSLGIGHFDIYKNRNQLRSPLVAKMQPSWSASRTCLKSSWICSSFEAFEILPKIAFPSGLFNVLSWADTSAHISPTNFQQHWKKKKAEKHEWQPNPATQFPDEEVEGRSSCTSSPQPSQPGNPRPWAAGQAPWHCTLPPPGHCTLPPPGASIREREAPDAGESGEPWTGARGPQGEGQRPGDLRGMMPCRLGMRQSSGWGQRGHRSAPDSALTAAQAVGPSAGRTALSLGPVQCGKMAETQVHLPATCAWYELDCVP